MIVVQMSIAAVLAPVVVVVVSQSDSGTVVMPLVNCISSSHIVGTTAAVVLVVYTQYTEQ